MAESSKHDIESEPSLAALWQKHGSKVLLVLAAAALIFAAVRYKRNQEANRAAEVQAALGSAWSGVQQAQTLVYASALATPEQMGARAAIENSVNQFVQTVQDDADASDTTKLASASLARGELYWALANAPAAAPSTQPTAASQPAKDYLGLAKTAYEKVVSDYPSQTEALTLARFGLAAVAENQGNIAEARKQYQALIDNSAVSAPDKASASTRLAALNKLEKPLLLLPASQPAAQAPQPTIPLKTDFPMMNLGTSATTKPATQP